MNVKSEVQRVDVIMPAFNAAATIERAVRSISAQTVECWRMIIVDDGSTDDTPAILRRLEAEDSRIHCVRTVNRGIVDALNTALALSSAPIIARFDADDIAFPDRLARQLDYLAANDDCVAVGCNVFHIDAEGRRTGRVTQFREEVSGDPSYVPAIEPYLLHPFLTLRRPAIEKAGGYRHVFHAEDADLYWRLSDLGRLANVVEVLGEYRIHDQSVSARSVLNGRIAAVTSQLAAISEKRRRNGRPEIAFERQTKQRYEAAGTLRGILQIGSEGLDSQETRYLQVATAAKLLELSLLRAYRLTRDDLRVMKTAMATNFATLAAANQRQLIFRQLRGTGPRRRLSELLRLVPWTIVPAAGWNLIKHILGKRLPPRLP